MNSGNGLESGPKMGTMINWLGCNEEAAIIEYGLGTVLFFAWFFTMKVLATYYERRKNAFRCGSARKRVPRSDRER